MATRLAYRRPVRADIPRLVEIRNQTVFSANFDPHTMYEPRSAADYDVIDGFDRPDIVVVEAGGVIVGFEGGHRQGDVFDVELIAVADNAPKRLTLMSCSWAIADLVERMGLSHITFEFAVVNPALGYINTVIPLDQPPHSRTEIIGRDPLTQTPHYARVRISTAWIKERATVEIGRL